MFERKTFNTKVFYRIKPAAGGGFIAETDDGKLPPLEADFLNPAFNHNNPEFTRNIRIALNDGKP